MAKLDRRTLLQGTGASALLAAFTRDLAAEDPPTGPARPRIKIGQMGVGDAHATKVSVFRASPDDEVVGIVEPEDALREKARSQPAFRDLRWMSAEELVNVPGLEAVLVETRVRDLLNVAEACVSAGKHIHLDKPAVTSLPQYRRLLDA
jgi:predicted dehydrogenase